MLVLAFVPKRRPAAVVDWVVPKPDVVVDGVWAKLRLKPGVVVVVVVGFVVAPKPPKDVPDEKRLLPWVLVLIVGVVVAVENKLVAAGWNKFEAIVFILVSFIKKIFFWDKVRKKKIYLYFEVVFAVVEVE